MCRRSMYTYIEREREKICMCVYIYIHVYLFIYSHERERTPFYNNNYGEFSTIQLPLRSKQQDSARILPFFPPRKTLEWLTQRRCSELAFLHGPCGEPERHQSLASASLNIRCLRFASLLSITCQKNTHPSGLRRLRQSPTHAGCKMYRLPT